MCLYVMERERGREDSGSGANGPVQEVGWSKGGRGRAAGRGGGAKLLS